MSNEFVVYKKTTPTLDRVFQCLLPHFPLRNGESTEFFLKVRDKQRNPHFRVGVLPIYGDTYEQWRAENHISCNAATHGTTANVQGEGTGSAGLLLPRNYEQVYLDKFLEYITRETTRIEWNDPENKLACARFLLDRVLVFYIGETFPDLDSTGVDMFGGWEGVDEERFVSFDDKIRSKELP